LRRFDGAFSRLSPPRVQRASGPRQTNGRAEQEFGHPNQVAGSDDVLAGCMGALDTTVPALTEATSGFAPAEDLFDPPAGTLAEGVRLRANAYAQGSALVTRRRMRDHALRPHTLDEAAGIVSPFQSQPSRRR